VPPSIWSRNRASLLFSFVTAAVVICLMTAAGARADAFDDAQAALEQAAAQAGGAPPPAAPVAVKKVEEPKKSPDSTTGGVAAPTTEPAPEPSNVNISIRVQSPGNDGAVIQQDHVTSNADFDRLERDLKRELDAKLKELNKQVSAPPPRIAMPVMHLTPKAPPPRRIHKTRPVQRPTPLHSALRTSVLRTSVPPTDHQKAAQPSRRHKAAAPPHHRNPFELPLDTQALSAGSSGGTSTPPPAPIAVLLAAACLAASMLVTTLWDAHRRRRSRLFASRLERPG
jgi:hypothetical protein